LSAGILEDTTPVDRWCTSYGTDATGSKICLTSAGANLPLTFGADSCPGGCDPAGRPVAPALYCTDITQTNTNQGDWQIQQGIGQKPDFVTGTVEERYYHGCRRSSVNHGRRQPEQRQRTQQERGDVDPGSGWRTAHRRLRDLRQHDEQDREIRVRSAVERGQPSASCQLQLLQPEQGWRALASISDRCKPGHVYRVQILIHDGDQNGTGGDAGQSCAIIAR
jgi:hypothetical protein